eukprot:gnl/MRDRNA2_/MRDRNA2_97418_c0_seq1.p1 gnl/MRDRNA2_/MRDRNA2_97418_c0~~gnl/MRDRNA2_/MRDRNA2_97418_c0_seq1.p1  ORF type:complete len:2329 (-),score=603.32 gnl/MRDRNA2_/MRDRNA2_97418_c0_seq1:172-7086(-)
MPPKDKDKKKDKGPASPRKEADLGTKKEGKKKGQELSDCLSCPHFRVARGQVPEFQELEAAINTKTVDWEGSASAEQKDENVKPPSLADDPRLQSVILKIWDQFNKDANDCVVKPEYEGYLRRVMRTLLPDLKPEHVEKLASNAWEEDADGRECMDFQLFFKAALRFTEVWMGAGQDAGNAAEFLGNIFARITTAHIMDAQSGEETVIKPRISLKFYTNTDTGDSSIPNSTFGQSYTINPTGSAPNLQVEVAFEESSRFVQTGSHCLWFDEGVRAPEIGTATQGMSTSWADIEDIIPFGRTALAVMATMKTESEAGALKCTVDPGADQVKGIRQAFRSETALQGELEVLVDMDPDVTATVKGQNRPLRLRDIIAVSLDIRSTSRNIVARPVRHSVMYQLEKLRAVLPLEQKNAALAAMSPAGSKDADDAETAAKLTTFANVLDNSVELNSGDHIMQPVVTEDLLTFGSLSSLAEAFLFESGGASANSTMPTASAGDPMAASFSNFSKKPKAVKEAVSFLNEFPRQTEGLNNHHTDLLDLARKPPVTIWMISHPDEVCSHQTEVCLRLAEKAGLQWLNAPYLLSVAVATPEDKRTPLANRVAQQLQRGMVVPSADALRLAFEFMATSKSKTNGYVLDFPAVTPDDVPAIEKLVEKMRGYSASATIKMGEFEKDDIELPPLGPDPPKPIVVEEGGGEGEGEGEGEAPAAEEPAAAEPPPAEPEAPAAEGAEGEPIIGGEEEEEEVKPPEEIPVANPIVNSMPRRLVVLSFDRPDLKGLLEGLRAEGTTGRSWPETEFKGLKAKHAEREALKEKAEAEGTDLPPEEDEEEPEEQPVFPTEPDEELQLWEKCPDVLQTMETFIPKPWKEPKVKVVEEGEEEKLPRLAPLPTEELLLVREEDDEAHLSTTLSGVEQVSKMLHEKFRIPVLNIHADGRSPEALCQLLNETCATFPGPVVPLPAGIEGAGDVGTLKELLRNGLGDEEVALGGPVSRKWSMWQQICPVSLFEKKLLPGAPEFSVDYAGSVFMMNSKEAQTEFKLWPKKYLQEPPSINAPGMSLGWSLLGPCGHGLAEIAAKIHDAYGLDVIDPTQIIAEAMNLTCEDDEEFAENPPPVDGPPRLLLEERADIRKGKPATNDTVVRLIAQSLKIRPNIDLIAKQKKELEVATEAVAKAQADGAEPPADIKLNDEGAPIVDYESPLLKPGRCFLLVGFPERAEQAEALREKLGLKLEKILTLKVADPEAEKNASDLLKDAGVGDLAPLEVALTSYEENTTALTEALGDSGTVMEVIPQELDEDNRVVCVRKAIDPFYTIVANPDHVEEIPDLDVEEEEPGEGEEVVQKEKKFIPWGLTGLYCPVTLMEEHWLFPGSKDFQHTVGNSVYAVCSEAASKAFIQEPSRYLPKTEVAIPPPRIMVIGPTGSGVATQCELLRKKYRIHTLALEDKVMEDVKRRVDELEAKRKVTRNDEKRGSPMIDADGNPIKQEEGTEEEDEPTFIDSEDMEQFHIEAMLTVMGPHLGACIVNGGFWSDLNNEDEDLKQKKSLSNLLIKARRAPDMVIILDVKTDVASKRKLDLEEIDRLEDEKKKAKRKAKEEEREKFLAEGGDVADLPDDEEEEDEEGEKASEIAVREFQERKEKQEGVLAELFTVLTAARVPVVKVAADRHINAVHKAVTWHCRPFVEYRNSLIARHQAVKASPKRCADLLTRGLARKSRYGNFSPMTPDIPLLSGRPDAFNYGTLFRNRLYYVRSEAEAEMFLQRPLEFVDLPEPSRVAVHPAVAVIGAPLAGKTTLCAKLCEKLGAVSLSIASVVEFVLKQTLPCSLSNQISACLRSGSPLPDALLVEALQFRLSFNDCVTKGWVLDDFPVTVQQARLLTEKGVCPHNVFCCTLPEHLTFARSAWLISKHSPDDSGELQQQQIPLQRLRLQAYTATSTQVRAYYGLSFGNVRILDGAKSMWAVYDRAVEEVKTTISQKLLYYRLTAQGLAAPVDGLGFTPERVVNNESFFRRYCPVSLTLGNEIVPCNNPRHIVEYKSKLYWFASEENQKIFLDDPESYLQVQLPASTPRLLSFADRQSSLFCQIEDYCPVALVDKKELVKCNGGFIVQYSGKYWNLQNKEACAKFMRRPTRYTQRAKLPNKKPPQRQQGNNALLAALQKGQSLEIADMLSYLQVSVAEAISTSLVEGGHRRLLYPGKSAKESALLFLASYLRAHNPLNTKLYRDECQATLDGFLDDCELPAELSAYVSRRHEAQAKEKGEGEAGEKSEAAPAEEEAEEQPGDSSKSQPWTFEDERRYEEMCGRFDTLFKKKS